MNETDFAIYVDDNTPYKTANTIDEVIESFNFPVNKNGTIRIGDTDIQNSEYEKLLGIKS